MNFDFGEVLGRMWKILHYLTFVYVVSFVFESFFAGGSSFIPHLSSARAQSAAYVEITGISVQAFPQIVALLDVYDAQGQFVTGLTPQEVTVFEDGQPRPVDALTESTPPAQLVVAVNPGPPLDVRDGQGITRYQRVMQALGVWAQARPTDSLDDLSLVTIAGPLIAHARVPDWMATFAAFQPDFRATTPNLQSLSIAIDTAAAPTPLPGMKRAVLFITPHMEDPNIASAVEPLIQRAVQSKVRVFVWFVDADLYLVTDSAMAFQSLALQTGGGFFSYTGAETLPDPESYFAPLRRLYTFSYTSGLTTPGEHLISVEVQTPFGKLTSVENTFSLDIQPPNPILVAPPMEIRRTAPPEDPYNTEILVPFVQPIEIIVEFPDGHPRPLKRTTLFVNGQAVAENTAEPFDVFVWDLSAFKDDGQHQIMVEAEDSLGLRKSSMAIPVNVIVIPAPRGLQAFLAKYRSHITYAAIGLAGIVLALILLSGRLRWSALRERRAERKRYEDPLTQPVALPVEVEPATGRERKEGRRLPWTRPARLPAAPAYLVRLKSDGEPATGNPIPLREPEMTFGTDPVQATQVLDDPSVSPLHARLRRSDDGAFVLADHGSVAGTWVNFEPVNREGRRLEHGDRIHIGAILFRFDLANPPEPPEASLSPTEGG